MRSVNDLWTWFHTVLCYYTVCNLSGAHGNTVQVLPAAAIGSDG